MPRMRIQHTSESAAGQIYIPAVNWALMIMVLALVIFFKSSSNLAAAYGIAVTGAMFIDTILLAVVLVSLWKWPRWKAALLIGAFIAVDMAYLGANLLKVPDGGYFPLLIGLGIFTMLTTWSRGRALMRERLRESAMPVKVFVSCAANSASRVPGTAVFMTSAADGVPHALLHNLKHNKVLHRSNILLKVESSSLPHVPSDERLTMEPLGERFVTARLRYGYMDVIDVPSDLAREQGLLSGSGGTSFFVGRNAIRLGQTPAMPRVMTMLYAVLHRNAADPTAWFAIPPNRVVELGSQIEL